MKAKLKWMFRGVLALAYVVVIVVNFGLAYTAQDSQTTQDKFWISCFAFTTFFYVIKEWVHDRGEV